MEVWFRSFSFLFMGDGCRFQPLIFQGVFHGKYVSVFFSWLTSRCIWNRWDPQGDLREKIAPKAHQEVTWDDINPYTPEV